MDYLNHTTKDLNAQEQSNYMERGRFVILNFGYDFIAFKSKARKSLSRLKKRFTTAHL
ncbi:hypothetical protein LV716_15965 [Flagellimonas sp. HMM57]|uniref:hypothetical protein n=1 Tax=unclassified Flagellimonas TaxID=2644544 RepID=UPI0013D1BB0B|nr:MULTISPECIES: hypothetical protein [unclassified Flagellimonas]MBS9463404.1 hypothetical protein [Flagellimonas sp. 389]UII75737.1 hypothetical protein LV716_15965 [Flagellimonas sp. HMM57]